MVTCTGIESVLDDCQQDINEGILQAVKLVRDEAD